MKEPSTDFGRITRITEDGNTAYVEAEWDHQIYVIDLTFPMIDKDILSKLSVGSLIHFAPEQVKGGSVGQLIYVFNEDEEKKMMTK